MRVASAVAPEAAAAILCGVGGGPAVHSSQVARCSGDAEYLPIAEYFECC